MLSKEEIEFNLKVVTNVMLNFEDELCDKMQERIKEIKEYINQLETDKQKLIEKLEGDKYIIESTYSQINGDYFMAQDKLDYITEILSMLKGEKE